jgi:autophagy-related protein 5
MTSTATNLIPSLLWQSTLPVLITHPSLPDHEPYLISVPRLSYLPLLLPRLNAFFGVPATSFHLEDDDGDGKGKDAEGIQMKNLPVGLLYDLYNPKDGAAELPWRLRLGMGPLFDVGDTFVNSVKEADFLRNGTAKAIMSMSKQDSTQLWNAVQDSKWRLLIQMEGTEADSEIDDRSSFITIYQKLLNAAQPLRHIPLRVYIPHQEEQGGAASIKIVQALVTPRTEKREVQTLGSALNKILPSLFPSRRDPILAEPILHGAAVPFRAPLEELMREAAYPDGWLHVSIVMLN